MTEIEFSVIVDTSEETQVIARLLQPFEEKHQHRVSLREMKWSDAWTTLLAATVHSTGPAISHIGSSWSTSLAAMNTLRSFSPQEVNKMGGSEVFFPAAWNSTRLETDPTVWSIPWTIYTHLISFRSDRLERARIDPDRAFRTPETMADTLARLQSLGMEYSWVIPTEEYYADLIHIVASFIWGAGGDFVSQDGKHIQICEPAAYSGLNGFFELFRYLPSYAKGLSYAQCVHLFAEGRVGLMIAGAEVPSTLVAAPDSAPLVRAHLRTAPLPGIPWVGGDNLVVWRHTRGEPQLEQAVMALVNFLVETGTQLAYSRIQNVLPVRPQVLAQLSLEPASLNKSVETSLRTGRPHRSTALWRVVEYRLGQALNVVAQEMLEDRAADINKLLEKHLRPVAERLNLTLEQ